MGARSRARGVGAEASFYCQHPALLVRRQAWAKAAKHAASELCSPSAGNHTDAERLRYELELGLNERPGTDVSPAFEQILRGMAGGVFSTTGDPHHDRKQQVKHAVRECVGAGVELLKEAKSICAVYGDRLGAGPARCRDPGVCSLLDPSIHPWRGRDIVRWCELGRVGVCVVRGGVCVPCVPCETACPSRVPAWLCSVCLSVCRSRRRLVFL